MPEPVQDAPPRTFRSSDTQPLPIGDPPAPAGMAPAPVRRRAIGYWLGALAAVLLLGGAAASYLRDRPAASPLAGAPSAREVPAELRPYYDRAMAGDPVAMRMLGTMYYNGLNVPQDIKEGVRWYRKAAAAGSVAAAKDLEQLGITPEK